MRSLCADHNWIDLSHRRLEWQPVNGSPARVQALNRLIVRDDQRILPGDDKLHAFGITALQDWIQGRKAFEPVQRLLLPPGSFESLHHSVGFGVERNLSPLPLGIDQSFI